MQKPQTEMPDCTPMPYTPVSRTRRAIAWVTLIAFVGQPLAAQAQVITSSTAAAQNRPTIDATANGVPLVQITAPNAGGVSVNMYNQYNVNAQGVILNNSNNVTLTQQGGYVAANPNMAMGPARIILNQVTSTSPSLLNGYTEVAGTRAEVIIANPNGITCNGCGFINTSRGVLTTGTPVFGGSGSLDAFRVTGGQIVVGAAGLDGATTDQLDLIARSVQVNGALWAKNLNVITGANQVNYANLGVQIITGDANKPTVGIDVALLGGMYASKIVLVGTEAGVGVNSLGYMAAQAGDFTLNNQGQITLGGKTTASGNLTVNSGTGITNSGPLYSLQSAQLTSAGAVTNSGLMAAQGNLGINAASLNSTGTLGAGVDTSGAAAQPGNILIATQGQTAATGQNVAGGAMSISASNINLANSRTNAWSGISLGATAGNIDLTGAWTQSLGTVALNAAGTVNNTNGLLFGSQVAGTAASFINNGGGLGALGNISLSGGTIDNTNGKIGTGAGSLTLATTGVLTNTGGQIGSGQDIAITASTLAGNGLVSAGRDASISLQGNYTNAVGNTLTANRNLTLATTGNLINQTTLQAAGAVTVNAANITNQGTMNAGATLTGSGAVISNTGNMIGSSVSLSATQLIENVTAAAGPAAFIGASSTTGLLELLAPSIQNRDDFTNTDVPASTMIFGNGQVVLAGGKNALGQYTNATQVLNQSALLQSGGNMTIYADLLTNTRRVLTMGTVFTQNGTVPASAGNYYLSPATVPGGVPPNFNIGGAINSGYLYTTWNGTTAVNAATAISPKSQIIVGGSLDASYGKAVQNYWSDIAAGTGINWGAANVDQNSWRGATPLTQRTTVGGDWWYQNYTGFVWTYSCYVMIGGAFGFLPASCGNIWSQVTDTVLKGYDSTITTKGTMVFQGGVVNNVAGSTPATPLGAQGQAPASTQNILALPQGGLYTINTAPQAKYLVVTNPAFTNRNAFMSSDWYFAHANIDPGTVSKRLGDGFYEQQLVRDQLLSLTGRAVMSNYANEQAQFMDMMTAGAKVAVELKLAPGLGLSADQAAKLTSDVVVMETREVQGQKVLVPIVYLARLNRGEFRPNGPIIAATDIVMKDMKEVNNSGSIIADNSLSINAISINNRGGNLQSGGAMSLRTSGDIDLTSGSLKAGSLGLMAGGNLLLNTDAKTVNSTSQGANGTLSQTSTLLGRTASMDIAGNAMIQTGGNFELNGGLFKVGGDLMANIGGSWQIGTAQMRASNDSHTGGQQSSGEFVHNVGSTVQVGGQSNINVTKDFTAQGAQINLQGGGSLKAGGNVDLSAATDTLKQDASDVSRDHTGRVQKYDETLTGTSLQSGKSLTVTSGKDINITASNVNVATGTATLSAGGNVNIVAGSERHESTVDDAGTSHGVTTTRHRDEHTAATQSDAKGSSVNGENVVIKAQNDINVTGSKVTADNDVTLVAGNDINISAATSTSTYDRTTHDSSSGLQASEGNPTDQGPNTTTQTHRDSAVQSQNKSLIQSRHGNVTAVAGNNLVVTGSDIRADAHANDHAAGDASAQGSGKDNKPADDGKGKVNLYAGNTAAFLAGQDIYNSSTTTYTESNPNAWTKERRTTTDTTASLSNFGSNVSGAGIHVLSNGDILLQGTNLVAGPGGIILDAGHDLKLLAAMDYYSHTHTEKLQTDGFRLDSHVFDDRRKNNKLEEMDQTAVVSTLQSEGDITTHSGHDTTIQASVLNAAGAIDLSAGDETHKGKLIFQGVKNTHFLSVADQHNSFGWQATTGHGDFVETLVMANITAGKGLSLAASGGIEVDIPPPAEAKPPVANALLAATQTPPPAPLTPEQALAKQLDELGKKPGQEWIAKLIKRNDVKWNQVKLAAEHWDYAHEGLSVEGAALLAIIVTAISYGSASSAGAAIVEAAAGEGAAAAGLGAAVAAALTAGMTTLASTAAVSLVNNHGDIGKTLNDLGQSQNVKALALAMITAGALQGLNANIPVGDKMTLAQVTAKSPWYLQLSKNVIDNVASASINHAINGGDFERQLEQSIKTAVIDTGAAQGANWIGDQKGKTLNVFTHKLAHAVAGCAAGAAKADDCTSGALGAVIGELAAEFYAPVEGGPLTDKQRGDAINFAKVMAGAAAAITGHDVNLAAAAGSNAAENNFLAHAQQARRDYLRKRVDDGKANKNELIELQALEQLDQNSDELYKKWKYNPKLLTPEENATLVNLFAFYAGQEAQYYKDYGRARYNLYLLMTHPEKSDAFSSYGYPYAGSSEAKAAYEEAHPLPHWYSTRDASHNQNLYYQARSDLIAWEHQEAQAQMGTPALMMLSGPIGSTFRVLGMIAGAQQMSDGYNTILSGDYALGGTEMALGAMGIFGSYSYGRVISRPITAPKLGDIPYPSDMPPAPVPEMGSASPSIYESTRPLDSEFPALQGVNPHYVEGGGPGSNTNCVSCTNAAHQRLTGQDPNAVATQTGYANENALLPSSGMGISQVPTTPAAVVEEMLQAGNGATRPLVIDQSGGVSHAINVVNRDGQVYFIDAQSGQIVTLKPDVPVRLGNPPVQ